MSEQAAAVADEKKAEKYPLRITVRKWDVAGKQFLKPQEGVEARKAEADGLVLFYVPTKQAVGRGQPVRGSEIVVANGTIYVVDSGNDTRQGEYRATCKKAAAKKP